MTRLLSSAALVAVVSASAAIAASARQEAAFCYEHGGAARRRIVAVGGPSRPCVGRWDAPLAVATGRSFLVPATRGSCPPVGLGFHRRANGISRTEKASPVTAALRMVRSPFDSSPSAAASASIESGGASLLSRIFGGVLTFLSKLLVRTDKMRSVGKAVSEAVNFGDIVPLVLVGWGALPLARAINSFFASSKDADIDLVQEQQVEAEVEAEAEEPEEVWEKTMEAVNRGGEDSFRGTYLFEAASHLSQAAKIGGAVYAIRVALVALAAGGFSWADQNAPWLSRASAQVAYTCWAALRFRYFKRRLLSRAAKEDPAEDGEPGRARFYDRITDYLIYVVAAFFLLDVLHVPAGKGLQSIFAVGGVGSLVFGLASKELASQLVSGFALGASEKFFEGDKILLGDGTIGKVLKIKALETELQAPDETITRIPNSQIVNQRVSNLSRQKMSQVKQTLRFSFEDVPKLPVVMREIKFQIQRSCGPNLVADGTRPFRAHWRDFQEDHVECVVQCHFRLSPGGDAYFDCREQMLQAIARSAEKHGVKFAVPLNYNKIEDVTPRPPSSDDSVDEQTYE